MMENSMAKIVKTVEDMSNKDFRKFAKETTDKMQLMENSILKLTKTLEVQSRQNVFMTQEIADLKKELKQLQSKRGNRLQ